MNQKGSTSENLDQAKKLLLRTGRVGEVEWVTELYGLIALGHRHENLDEALNLLLGKGWVGEIEWITDLYGLIAMARQNMKEIATDSKPR